MKTDTPLVYLAGPMRGLPGLNFARFNDAARNLRRSGYATINPAETAGGYKELPRRTYMAIDVGYVMQADCLCVLPNWYRSEGAVLEVLLAHNLRKPVFVYDAEQGLGPELTLTGIGVAYALETGEVSEEETECGCDCCATDDGQFEFDFDDMFGGYL